MNATMMLDAPGLSEEQREVLREILTAAERAAGLTSRLRTGGPSEIDEPLLDVNAVLGGLERMLAAAIGDTVVVTLKTAPDLGLVRAAGRPVEQVVMNLALSARDAMPEAGRLTIETSNVDLGADAPTRGLVPGRYVLIRLSESTRTTREGAGALGLSTAYDVVLRLGGRLLVQDEIGKARSFEVYLPLAADRESARPRSP